MSVAHKFLFMSVLLAKFLGSLALDARSDLLDDDRRDFIVFHVQRGYKILREAVSCSSVDEYKKQDCEFSLQLYKHASECCSISKEDAVSPRDVICFDDGHCIDIGDPGIHPCQ